MDKKRKLHLLVAVILAAAILFCFWPRTFGHFVPLEDVQSIQVHLSPDLLSEAEESIEFNLAPEDPGYDAVTDLLSHSRYYVLPTTKAPNWQNFPLDYHISLSFRTGVEAPANILMRFQDNPCVVYVDTVSASRSNGTVRCYNSKDFQQGLLALLLESAPAGTPQ